MPRAATTVSTKESFLDLGMLRSSGRMLVKARVRKNRSSHHTSQDSPLEKAKHHYCPDPGSRPRRREICAMLGLDGIHGPKGEGGPVLARLRIVTNRDKS